MKSDAELLRSYAESRAEADFAAFVARHLSFVYHTALRRTGGDPHRAAEIAQRVFTAAARRATALARHPSLAGWLHVATRHAALDLARREARQRHRETAAYHMNSLESSNDQARWEELQPVIDEALDALGDRDREAILARFFERQGFREIGERLRISESAARMRVDRALEKLRRALERRGIASTAAALVGGLSHPAAAAVPAGLASAVCGAACSAPAWGLAAATLLTMSKFKTTLIAAAALAVLLSPPLVQVYANRELNTAIAGQRATIKHVEVEHATLAKAMASAVDEEAADDAGRLAQLRARAAILQARPPGVLDAELKPPANRGWDTPAAAFETTMWAFLQGDWQTMGRSLVFDAKTKAQVDAFYSTLAPAVRAQYPTPELFVAHAWYDGSLPSLQAMPHKLQVVATEWIDGPEPRQIRAWGVDANGKEHGTVLRMERTPNGWAVGASHTAEIVGRLLANVDPATGQLRPKEAKNP